MRKITAISRTVLRLLFRKGTGWGLLAATAAVAVLIFFSSSGDGVLLNELRLRMRYSGYFFTAFISFCVLFLACVSMRGDIEDKQMHMLTSYPVKRLQIWLGKWLGLWMFAAIALLTGTAAVAVSAAVFTSQWQETHPDTEVPEAFWQYHTLTPPQVRPYSEQVEELYQKRLLAGDLPDRPEWGIRQDMLREIRRDQQLLAPGESRTWTFSVDKSRIRSDEIILRYKFYAQNERDRVPGRWVVGSDEAVDTFSEDFFRQPYRTHELRVPVDVVPPGGTFEVTFEGTEATPSLIFPRDNGLEVLYQDSRLWPNLARGLLIQWLYLGVVVAVGLTVATAFTFAVSAFVSLVFMTVAVSSSFFQSVVRELMWEEPSLLQSAAQLLIRFGVWLSRGLQPPPVLSRFTEGLSVRFSDILTGWGAAALPYALIVAVLGMYLLTRKELDRVH